MWTRWQLALALLGTALSTPAPAWADIYITPPRIHFRPWLRPRLVVIPPAPPVVTVSPQASPYCCYQAPPAPPVVVQPPSVSAPAQATTCCEALPAPPVYQPAPVYPPAPVYQPAPVYPPAPAPQTVVPAPTSRPASRPGWPTRFGIGGRFAGLINTDTLTQFGQLGFGGELLFRTGRHLVLELAGEYHRTVDGGFSRFDVPVTFGLRIHIGAPDWVVSPYFVLATGLDYASLDFLRAVDKAWFAEGQAGGGLEVRLGRHFALSADVRASGRYRLTAPEEVVASTLSINGQPFQPMQNQGAVQFRLGAAVYF